MTQGPRICRAPDVIPSRGATLPSLSITRSSTPNGERPCLHTTSICSSSVKSSQLGVGAPIVPMGDVSVMPHAWATRTPDFIKRSIIARGAAEPPMVTSRSLPSDASRPAAASASKCANIASQTVGTPALCVTPS